MVDSVNYPITLMMAIKYAIFDNQCGDRRPCMYLNVCTRVFKFVNDFDPDFFFTLFFLSPCGLHKENFLGMHVDAIKPDR